MSSTAPAGTITIANRQEDHFPLGLGTMLLTEPGTWGDPADR